ncbi:2-amino-4-hydroxy-6-hydroxymethyldihydropteridine diphosphokinase [Glaciihabitans tibetensis]|uniref:2-amino-4-hydroxy-6-hydroxymethyldihydropteridine diphosphokinase n=1 Tax=Glaciihabitans tibetensis TaxID=1266600 RepID=A0A2T0VB59_9MICO|nr:2-amino-4-hydroxy-6-hydroxymethyldihydropteridine diphosphokinase [Glaciihabitans tibetensis]PRY67432.1 2-amino-4-hydroxy-6-hydroxymethyldihydropteridine diphosphokinase [Glaciihabitans tibetensis]
MIRKERINPATVPPAPATAPAPAATPAPTTEPPAADGVVAILSLGSNLGDRERTIRDATARVAGIDRVTLTGASALVETPALKLDGIDHAAPAYLNAILRVSTTLAPEQLLEAVNAIENALGRVRVERWGDRTLDIDIVTFGDVVSDDATLTLPHPRAAERGFVLVPWLELDPHAVLPGRGAVSALPAATSNDVQPYSAEALL